MCLPSITLLKARFFSFIVGDQIHIYWKKYKVGNNLPKLSDKSILHLRSSTRISCYTEHLRYVTELPTKTN